MRHASSNPSLAHLMTLSVLLFHCFQNEGKVKTAGSQRSEQAFSIQSFDLSCKEVPDVEILYLDEVLHNGTMLQSIVLQSFRQDASVAKQSSFLARTKHCIQKKRHDCLTKRTSRIPDLSLSVPS